MDSKLDTDLLKGLSANLTEEDLKIFTKLFDQLKQTITAIPATTSSSSASASSIGIIPVGGIIPWAKTITGVPALPWGFKECDGSVLSDAESLLNGTTLPNINGSNYFLRGAATSGGTGGASTVALTTSEIATHLHALSVTTSGISADHTHTYGTYYNLVTAAAGGQTNIWAGVSSGVSGGVSADHTHTINTNTGNAGSGSAHENKPPYYDVVYIIRVK